MPWLTFFGGSGNETLNSIALDSSSGTLYIAGSTASTDLPTTSGVIQPASNGPTQGYIASINTGGLSFGFVTYLGGGREDSIQSIVLPAAGQIAVGGSATSTGFPLANAIEPTFLGNTTSLYASTNSGNTWAPSDSSLPTSVSALSVDPSNPGTMLAASGEGYYAWFRTTNNGTSWTPGGQSDVSAWWHATGGQFARSANNPQFVYFCYPESEGPGTGTNGSWWIAFGSSDGGATWNELASPPASSSDPLWGIAVSPTDGNSVLEVTGSGAVFRSTNGGVSFSQVSTLPSGMDWMVPYSVVASPDGSVYVGASQNVFKSTDFGDTWTSASVGGLPDWQGMGPIAVSASNPSVVYAGSIWNGNLYKTTDAGTTWTQVTAPPGINLGNGTSLVVAPSNPNVVYAASGNQGAVSTDGGNTWSPGTLPGYVSAIAVSQSDPTNVFIATGPGASDGFVAKLSTDGKTLLWSTFYTGSSGAYVSSLTPAGSGGDVWVTGSTSSTDLPITSNAYSSSPFGGSAFFARISDSTPACNVSISPQSVIAYGAQTVGFGVTDTNGCNWTASPSDPAWIQVQSPNSGSGTGSGVVSANLAANNTGSTRTGSVNVNGAGDGSVAFSITQAASSCTYTLSPIGSLPDGGGDVTFNVTAPAGCPWSIVPQDPSITVVSGGTGTGSGTVILHLPANASVQWLNASVQVGPNNVQISEADACTFSLLPTNLGSGAASGSMTVTVSPAGCYWNASSDSNWLSVSGNGTGSGTFPYTVQPNNYLGSRTAHITLDNRQFPVTQATVGVWTLGEQQVPLVDGSGNGAYTWALVSGTLPPGLSLRTDVPSFFPSGVTTGLIGVATTPGTYNFTLSATNGGGATDLPFTMKITALTLKDQVQLPDAFAGSPYSYQLTALNPAGMLTWTPANDGSMPSGMSLSSSGLLAGTPGSAANYHINFSFNDGTDTVNGSVSLYVSVLQITSPGLLPNATQNASYNYQLHATGGTGPYTFSPTCCMPNGLNLDSSGAITGTVNGGEGKNQFWVYVNDSQNNSYHKLMVIDVIGTPESMPQLGTYGEWDDCTIGQGCSRGIGVNWGTAPYTWAVTGLPPGMDFRSGSGTNQSGITPGDVEIWGTPTSVGLYQLQVTVTDNGGLNTTQTFPLNVSGLIEDTGLQNGTVGVTYSSTIRIVGGVPASVPPYYTAVEIPTSNNPGTLPAGTSLSGLTVSGTPLEGGSNFNPRFRFTDSAGTVNTLTQTQNFYINGAAGTSSSVYQYTTLYATLNQSWQFQLGACCAASYAWTLAGGVLPDAITLSSGGLLSGTPDIAGTSTFLVQATNSSNSSDFATRQITIIVTPLNGFGGTLPYGNVNAPYNQQLTTTGGTGTLTWTLQPGNFLPPGFTLSGAGLLSGTPTATGAYGFCLVVTDSGSNSSIQGCYNLNIYPSGGAPPPSIAMSPNFGTERLGTTWLGLSANGGNGTYTWAFVSGTLPPGLALRTDVPFFLAPAQAGLMGVATTPGNYNFTLSVSSGGQTVSQPFTMRISGLDLQDGNIPDAFVNTPFSYTFTPINNAGQVSFTVNTNSTNGAMPPGLSLSSNGVLSGTPTAAGNYEIAMNISDGVDTQYEQYNLYISAINITTPGTLPNGTQNSVYSTNLAASGGAGGYTWTGGPLPAGLTLSSSGTISGTITSGPGPFGFQVTATDSSQVSYSKNMMLDVIGSSASLMQINGGTFNDAVLGDHYQTGVNVCCGGTAPFTWSVTGLPPGLTFGNNGNPVPGNVQVYGVPQKAGTSNVQFTVTDATGASTSYTFPIHVSVLDKIGPDGNSWSLPNGTINTPYSANLLVLGGTGPYGFGYTGLGSFPDGLTTNSSALSVTGTPLENGGFNPGFQFTDSAGNTLFRTEGLSIGSGSSNITINCNGYNCNDLGTVPVGTSYSTQFNACCVAAYLWSALDQSTLPPSLSISTAGQLSGTVTTPGTYTFLIAAQDVSNSGNVGVKSFILVVTPITITTNNLPDGTVGSPYNATLSATGGTGTLTWTRIVFGNWQLPPGLTLAPTGTISGTPTSSGSYNITVEVTDGSGNIATRGYGINVYAPSQALAQTITFAPLSNQTYGTAAFTVSASASSGLPVSFASTTQTVCTVSGSTVTLIDVGTCTIQASQTGNVYYLAAPSVSQSFKVTTIQQFNDVPPTATWFDAANLMYEAGVTTGCVQTGDPATQQFCPDNDVTRQQMAAFLVRAVTGTTNPAIYNTTPYFQDVDSSSPFFPHIQKLMELGITTGCSTNPPLFCPLKTIPRWQMAMFMVRARLALYGASFDTAATPYFTDVPTDVEGNGMPFPYIQRSYEEDITSGCGTNPMMYCPDRLVTRGQMASFIMRGLFNKTMVIPSSAPMLTGVSPNTVSQTAGSQVTVTITSVNTNFQSGDTVSVPSGMLTVGNIVVNSATSISATLTVNAGAVAGPQALVVTTGGQNLTLPLAIKAGTY